MGVGISTPLDHIAVILNDGLRSFIHSVVSIKYASLSERRSHKSMNFKT